jgi:hypothetical protein
MLSSAVGNLWISGTRPQVQQPAYGATSQAPVMSSGSNPNLDKAFNDLMMLKQKGFFDKAKSSF